MFRSRYAFALIATTTILAACSDTTAPRGSGKDDKTEVGDRRGKKNDPQPHPIIGVLSQPSASRSEAEIRREPEARREPEVRGGQQPGDDKGNRRGRGNDDGPGHH